MTINQMIVHAYGQFTETFSRTSTIHLGIFLGLALFDELSVSVDELSADSCPAEFMLLKQKC